jgi:hypothetical protein
VPLLWTSWNPQGHSRPVTGLLYLFIRLQGSWIGRQQVPLKRRASPTARNDVQKTVLLQYLRLSQRSCWRIVFLDVTLCHGTSSFWRFQGSHWLRLQGPCSTLKMNKLQLFKTPRSTGPVTKNHIPLDLTARSYGYVKSGFLRPVTSSTNLKRNSTVWPVPPHPQRTPLCLSLCGAKYPVVSSLLFGANSTTHFRVLSWYLHHYHVVWGVGMVKVLVVAWLRRSATALTLRLPGFDLRPAHVGFMVGVVSFG